MKVVHIIPGLDAGGAETALYRFLLATQGQDCKAVVISLTGPGDLGPAIEALGVRVVSLGMRPGRPTPAGLWRLGRCVRQMRPDLLQGWMYHGNLAVLGARWIGGYQIPAVWNIRHSLDDLPGESHALRAVIALSRWLSASASVIVYNSRRSLLQHETNGFAAARTAIISNGFDTELFRPNPEAGRAMRQALGIGSDAFVIALIARYHPIKGHSLFLQAAAAFAQHHPETRFVLAGKGLDACNFKVVESIRMAGLEGRVVLAGERRDLPEFYNGIDLVTLTSHAEAFPNVLGEAMACGIPCVTTDVGDAAWLVGETGTVVPCGDAEAICRAWQAHLSLDVQQRQQLGSAARRRIKECFSQEAFVEHNLQLYRHLVRPSAVM